VEEQGSLLVDRKFLLQDDERLRKINERLVVIGTIIAGALPVAGLTAEVGVTMVG
jgi:hypothetical protein